MSAPGAPSTELLFLDAEFRRQVERSLDAASKSVDILAGYAKFSAMEWLSDQLKDKQLNVTLVVGWTIRDLVNGSSDLGAYQFARNRSWNFAMRPDLHAKIFWIDRKELLIGSANLTSRGLHIGIDGNIEAGVRITPTNVDITKLDQLIARSLWLNDELVTDIEEQIGLAETLPELDQKRLPWPPSIEGMLSKMNDFLWVDDLLMTDPTATLSDDPNVSALISHDRSLLGGLYREDQPNQLTQALRKTRIIDWTKCFLDKQEGKWARFGSVSAELHDALLDDPKPYRRDVKALQSNLFAWIQHARMPELELRQHRRTTSIHLVPDQSGSGNWF